jgi:histidinol-phosphate/aromatic aminotransferase/cobyric acid decarboxylase-like protein
MSRSQNLQGKMNQHTRPDPVPLIDVAAQRRRLGKSVDEAVARVLAHCQFINGPEVTELEAALGAFCGAKHVVTCASGTDALLMVLMAKGVGRGDAVFCPSFTFCATASSTDLPSLRRCAATSMKGTGSGRVCWFILPCRF